MYAHMNVKYTIRNVKMCINCIPQSVFKLCKMTLRPVYYHTTCVTNYLATYLIIFI